MLQGVSGSSGSVRFGSLAAYSPILDARGEARDVESRLEVVLEAVSTLEDELNAERKMRASEMGEAPYACSMSPGSPSSRGS